MRLRGRLRWQPACPVPRPRGLRCHGGHQHRCRARAGDDRRAGQARVPAGHDPWRGRRRGHQGSAGCPRRRGQPRRRRRPRPAAVPGAGGSRARFAGPSGRRPGWRSSRRCGASTAAFRSSRAAAATAPGWPAGPLRPRERGRSLPWRSRFIRLAGPIRAGPASCARPEPTSW